MWGDLFGLLKDKDGLIHVFKIDTSAGFDLIHFRWVGVDRFSLSEIIVVSVEQNLSLALLHMRTEHTGRFSDLSNSNQVQKWS